MKLYYKTNKKRNGTTIPLRPYHDFVVLDIPTAKSNSSLLQL